MTHRDTPADALPADAQQRAEIIATALPYMLRYDEATIVVKYGGHAMGDPELAADFAEDITLLTLSGVRAVVVHGGGPQIGRMLDRLGIVSEFREGLRVTTRESVEIIEMVLAGAINKDIVKTINAAGGKAVGLSGKDGRMVLAEPIKRTVRNTDSNIEQVLDLGFVGEPVEVRRDVLDVLARHEIVPVIAPVAEGADGETYNINADTFAGAIAGALGATRLLFLTDVDGVLGPDGELIRELTVAEARRLMAAGVIAGGMVPKVETCIEALERGVEGVVILNGKTPHAVLLELFTDGGAGTLLTR